MAYPTDIDNFTDYVDGTTIMEAATLNLMQKAIEALETKVGVNSSAVSASHDYKLTNNFNFSALSIKDSDAQDLLASHAYLATSDGFVYALYHEESGTGNLIGYVDTDSNPASGGNMVAKTGAISGTGHYNSIAFSVASGEYFEVTADGTASIFWRSVGALSAPVDQD